MKMDKVKKAWALYDVGNSAYQLVIVTAIFPIYYASQIDAIVSVFGYTFSKESFYLILFSIAYLIVAFLNPVLSGISDDTGQKKQFMSFFTVVGIVGTLFLVGFTKQNLWLGFIGTILSTIGYTGSIVFYNAYLPQIALESEQDELSGKGYAWGYFGSMVLLIVALIPFIFNLIPSGLAARIVFFMVAVWWSVFSYISISRLPNNRKSGKNVNLFLGHKKLIEALKSLHNHIKARWFLSAYFFYIMGVQTVFYSATLFGKEELKLDDNMLIVTMLLIQILGAIGATILSKMANIKGNLMALITTVSIWTLITVYAYFIESSNEFIVASIVVGFVMGGIQSLSRSTFSKWTLDAPNKSSLFSLMDFLEKIGIVIGTFSFAVFQEVFGGMRPAILVLSLFFVVGLILLICIPIFTKKVSS